LNQTSTLTALTGRSRPLLRGLWSAEGLDDVEIAMRRLVAGGRVDRLGIVLRELLESGGKRLRARLALATLEALGEDRQKGVAWAAACELLHTATLLHDDVQDGDTVRRDRPTAWRSHGVAQAINAGDLALMLPYSAIDHIPVEPAVKWQLTRLLARYAEVLEAMDQPGGRAGDLRAGRLLVRRRPHRRHRQLPVRRAVRAGRPRPPRPPRVHPRSTRSTACSSRDGGSFDYVGDEERLLAQIGR
jgi:hypothetical protein